MLDLKKKKYVLCGTTYVKKDKVLSSVQQDSGAEIGAERYAGELDLHGYGTEPDSRPNEDDLWLARTVRDGWGETTLIKVFL